MAINAIYEKKREFVDALNVPLAVLPDFEKIEYTRDYVKDEEFIRIKDTLGYAYYVNVTGNSEAAILQEVARAMLGQKPIGFVTNVDKKRAIAPLFRRAV